MAENNEEKKIIMSEEDQSNYEKRMGKFECPFTWETREFECMEQEFVIYDKEEVIPLMKLMRCIVHVHEYVKHNKDSQIVLDRLSDCDNAIVAMQKSAHPEISIEAAFSVLRATKCFVFLRLQMETELKQMFAETQAIDSSEKKQTSTIKACKSLAFFNYSRPIEAIKFIREAIADNPNCDFWYLIWGKILRSKRRAANYRVEPDAEEIESFEIAYNMMKNPVYGVYLGKAYSEHRNHRSKALAIFKRILPDVPQNDSLFMIIALGCIQMKNFVDANRCLDKVVNKSNSMYLHYKGLYHSKQGQYKESCSFLEKAIKDCNYQAEYNYIYSMQKSKNRNFDLTQHLLQMLDKYRNGTEDMLQTIILQLAYTYFKKDKNIEASLRYFLEAIEINPDGMRLKESYCPVLFCQRDGKNVYEILSQVVLPIVRRQPHKFDENINEIARKLREHCNNHLDLSNFINDDFINMS